MLSLSRYAAALVVVALAGRTHSAAAEDRPFALTYTPYLDERGESEVMFSTTAGHGQAGSEGARWYHRLEFEHAVSDRFSAALYLNAKQEGSLHAPLRFDGPSVEAIYRLSAPGPRAVDAAGYLEIRVNGDETELEPRVLLAHRGRRGLIAVNAVGEIEKPHGKGSNGETEKLARLTFGATRRLGTAWSLGIEGWVEQSFVEAAADPRALFVGPALTLASGGLRWTAAWAPQVAGSPRSRNGLDLDDFPRSELRVAVGVDL